MLLPVARETCAHIMSHGLRGNGGLGQISMTSRTRDARLIMRRVAESDVSLARKTVDAFPGNLHPLISVFDDFLDFRAFPSHLVMTQHAFPNGWNPGSSTSIGSHVTIKTVQPQLHVCTVGKYDRLSCQ